MHSPATQPLQPSQMPDIKQQSFSICYSSP
jgi:hypothetical protein